MAVNVVLKSVWDDKGIKSAQKEFADFGKGLGTAFAAVGAATAVAAGALVKFGADSIAAAENVAQADNRLAQVAKSMGIFGSETQAVTDRLIKFAEANELTVAVDAEVIKATQAKLLTFKNLTATADEVGGAMDRATMAALDLAAAGFGSAETNAVQLGKALQDPIKGITALARAGVTFTAQEKENIKVLVESGKTLEAQNLILQAIETQVGGTAQATAKASDKMRLAFENVSETVGAALLPVFNEFSNELVKIAPELSEALAPAAAEIAQIFRDRVLPAIQDFTKWLASPEGTKTLRDLTNAVLDAIEGFINFVGWVAQNKDAIVTWGIAIASVIAITKTATTVTALYKAALVLFTTQVTTASGATTAFGTALKALPWVALIAAGAAFVTTMSQYADAVYGSKINTEGLTEAQIKEARQLENLRRQLSQYEYALANSTDANKALAEEGIAKTRAEIAILEIKTKGAISELNRFNNIKLDKLRKEIGDTAGELNRFNNLRNGFVAAYKPDIAITQTTTATGGAVEKAFDKVQKFIKDAQKDLLDAQAKFNDTVSKAQKRYTESVLKTQADFGTKLAGIIQESQDRLRNAYAQATATNVASLFDAFKSDQQKRTEAFAKAQEDLVKAQEKLSEADKELKETLADPKRTQKQLESATSAYNKAKSEFEKINSIVSKGLTKENPVDVLIQTLRDKLSDSSRLLENAGELASAGFSQTFIEQIVAAGTDTGNELAQAILDSSPEVQRELQALFVTIERLSNTGMDALSRTIYEKQGLATAALKELYAQTQEDLQVALFELKLAFDAEIIEANQTLIRSIDDISGKFRENINSMKGDLGGLGSAVAAFEARLRAAQTAAGQRIETITSTQPTITTPITTQPVGLPTIQASQLGEAAGIFIDSAADIGKVMAFIAEQINALQMLASQTTGDEASRLRGLASALVPELQRVNALSGKPITGQTIININVKTDSTQSLAMVGKTLGNTINKYVTTGGQVLVSPVG